MRQLLCLFLFIPFCVAAQTTNPVIKEKITAETKKYRFLEDELLKMKREIADMEQKIRQAESAIAQSESQIKRSETEQQATDKNLERQRGVVSEQRAELSRFDRPGISKQMKELEEENRKLKRENEKASKDIGRKTEEIEKLKLEIANLQNQSENNLKQLEAKTKLISEKQAVIVNNGLLEKEEVLEDSEKKEKQLQRAADALSQNIAEEKTAIEKNKALRDRFEAERKGMLEQLALKQKERDLQKQTVENLTGVPQKP